MHSNHLLFVYGSLRNRQSAHDLLKGASFRGLAHSSAAFTMYDLGEYPAVIAGGIQRVVGEVYAIDARILERIDHYEDCPREYRRQRMATTYGRAWIYLYRRRLSRRIVVSGDWLSHRVRRKRQLAASTRPWTNLGRTAHFPY